MKVPSKRAGSWSNQGKLLDMNFRRRGLVRAVLFDGYNHSEVSALGFQLEPTAADDRHALLRYRGMTVRVARGTWLVDVHGIPITMKPAEFERLYEPVVDPELVAS